MVVNLDLEVVQQELQVVEMVLMEQMIMTIHQVVEVGVEVTMEEVVEEPGQVLILTEQVVEVEDLLM